MNFLSEELKVGGPGEPVPRIEFVSPRTKQSKLTAISTTRDPWADYKKRKEIVEDRFRPAFIPIFQAQAQDGIVNKAVAKFVNGIFLRGYKLHTLKPAIEKYLKTRQQMIVDAMPYHDHIDAFFHDIARDLVAYANVYIAKIRRKQNQVPKGINIKGIPRILPKGKEDQKPQTEPQDAICSYELIHPATIFPYRDQNGNVTKYEQWPWGEHKKPSDPKKIRTWDADQIIHITVDRQSGFPYGTPFLGAAMDDIRMLRNLEDHVSRLTYRFAFPFTQARVGLPQPGMGATEEMLDFWRKKIQEAPPDATMVTPEFVEFLVVGAEGEAMQLQPYLQHDKSRVFTGLGVSSVAMGEGDTANRSTADAMSVEMHDQIKHYQNVLSRTLTNEIYRELLMEGGFDLYADIDKNWVQVIFNEIETESQIARETHIIQKLQTNAITISEARLEMGKQPFTEKEWMDTYLVKFLLPQDIVKVTGVADLDEHAQLMLEKHKADMAMNKAQVDVHKKSLDVSDSEIEVNKANVKKIKGEADAASAGEGPHVTTSQKHSVSTKPDGSKSVSKALTVKRPVGHPTTPGSGVEPRTANIVRPANQFGKRVGPKRKTEAADSGDVVRITQQEQFLSELTDLYEDMRDIAIEYGTRWVGGEAGRPDTDLKFAELLMELTKGRITSLCHRYLNPSFYAGIAELETDAELQPIANTWSAERGEIKEYNRKTIGRLLKDTARPALRALDAYKTVEKLQEKIHAIFDTHKWRLTLIAEAEIPQSFWMGYASAAYVGGVDLDLVIENEACEHCMSHPIEFRNTHSASRRLAEVPVLHPNCNCGLRVRKPTE